MSAATPEPPPTSLIVAMEVHLTRLEECWTRLVHVLRASIEVSLNRHAARNSGTCRDDIAFQGLSLRIL